MRSLAVPGSPTCFSRVIEIPRTELKEAVSKLHLPEQLSEVLFARDKEQTAIKEHELAAELVKALGVPEVRTEEERAAAGAVVSGFNFQRHRNQNPWGIYWNSLTTWQTADGKLVNYPDATEVTVPVLELWKSLSLELSHPELQARFADLAWEIGQFRNRMQRKEPADSRELVELPVTVAHTAIDGYLRSAQRFGLENEHDAWSYLARAVDLAVQLGDKPRRDTLRDALFDFYDKVSSASKMHQWWHLHDLTWSRRKVLELSDSHYARVVAALEAALARHADMSNKETFDPHAAMRAAERLAAHRVKAKDRDAAARDLLTAGAAFESAAAEAGGLVAIAWLEDLIPKYRRLGQIADAVRVEKAIRSRAADARAEMKLIETEVEIPKEELEGMVGRILGDSLDEALRLIAANFLLRESTVQQSLEGMLKDAPLLRMMPSSIMSGEGFTQAVVGSVDDDLTGRSIHHGAERLNWHAGLLHLMFERAKKKYQFEPSTLLAYVSSCPFFSPGREALLKEGIEAWHSGDSVKAIHVLVPQIEAAARDFLEYLGGSVVSHNPQTDGFEAISLGAVLHHPALRSATGIVKDIRFHLIVLLTDARGINLRNHVAHGVAQLGLLGTGMANWVMHCVLLIAVLRPKGAAPGGNPA